MVISRKLLWLKSLAVGDFQVMLDYQMILYIDIYIYIVLLFFMNLFPDYIILFTRLNMF